FGIKSGHRLAVLRNINDGPLRFEVGVIVLGKRAASEGVGADLHAVAVAQFLLFFLIEGGAGQANGDDDDAEVHDVSAVAASVAAGELQRGGKKILSAVRADDARPAEKFAEDSRRHRSEEHTSGL